MSVRRTRQPKGDTGATGAAGAAGGAELFYAAVTSTVHTTATTEAGAEELVSLGAQTYAAVPTLLEFFVASVTFSSTQGAIIACLYDDTTMLCRFADYRQSSNTDGGPMRATIRLTPSAGSHTYKVKGMGSAALDWLCGSGSGGAGTYAPMFVRATLV